MELRLTTLGSLVHKASCVSRVWGRAALPRGVMLTAHYNGNISGLRSRSQSCPFCRDSLKRVNSGDLWVYMDHKDIVDMSTITRENLRRLFMFIDKLPLIVPNNVFDHYDTHIRFRNAGGLLHHLLIRRTRPSHRGAGVEAKLD
ncbi:hypothetical protein H5410_007820 [Solanum commersonii]|uniref:Uncharacterized protein n=1 Tax=Solanum commersonii TaxID=4109 RepID=A0A9J6AER0_SOLCO|nr:hypothetical protein H5410_007820 [Solanum commersonii]